MNGQVKVKRFQVAPVPPKAPMAPKRARAVKATAPHGMGLGGGEFTLQVEGDEGEEGAHVFHLAPMKMPKGHPAVMPQLVIGLRITLGIAWMVVVAAEMIAVNSGLGFMIVDARNAGNRYDLEVAGMVMIGIIGLLLDVGIRSLERIPSISWGYSDD